MAPIESQRQEEQILTLNQKRYRIVANIGGGAVAAVSVAVPLDSEDESQVIIKRLRPDDVNPSKIEGMRREAEVLRVLNAAERHKPAAERLIVALLDSGDLAPNAPFVIQEMAPPAFIPFNIKSLGDERTMLAVALAVAEAMTLAHEHNFAFSDFNPDTKRDRIRLEGLEGSDTFSLRVIDWNITGGPEDFAKDLLNLGGYLYYLFVGPRLEVKKPTYDLLQSQADRDHLTEGTRQIIRRLLNLDPARVYRQITDVRNDLAWQHTIMVTAELPAPTRALRDAVLNARTSVRPDRVIAIADLAARLPISPDDVKMFADWSKKAFEDLEKQARVPLSDALLQLGSGYYEQAVQEFDEALRKLAPGGAPARHGRIYRLLARAGSELKEHSRDPRQEKGWKELDAAAEALEKREWKIARDAVYEATRTLLNVKAVAAMAGWAEAGLLVEDALRLITSADSKPNNDFTRWLEVEGQQIDKLNDAVGKLKTAQDMAPDEPDFLDIYEAQHNYLNERRDIRGDYITAEEHAIEAAKELDAGKSFEDKGALTTAVPHYQNSLDAWEDALKTLDHILERDGWADMAKRRQERWLPSRDEARWCLERLNAYNKAAQLLNRGEYEEVLQLLRAGEYDPTETGRELTKRAEAGLAAVTKAQRLLTELRHLLQSRSTVDLDKAGQEIDELNEQSKHYYFPQSLVNDLRAASDEHAVLGKLLQPLSLARQENDDEKIKQLLERLSARGVELTPDETSELEDVERRLATKTNLASLTGQRPDTVEALKTLLAALPPFASSPDARRAWMTILDNWRQGLRVRDLDELVQDIEHIRHLSSLPSAFQKDLGDDLALANKALGAGGDIPERGLPTWLGEATLTSEKIAKVANLTATLAELSHEARDAEWPALVKQAEAYEERLVNVIRRYYEEQWAGLKEQAGKVTPFDTEALKKLHASAEQCLQVVRGARGVKINLTDLQDLLGALDGRIKGEERLASLVGRVVAAGDLEKELRNPQTVAEMGRAPYIAFEQQYLPTNHIAALDNQLTALAGWEKHCREVVAAGPARDNAWVIGELDKLVQRFTDDDKANSELQALVGGAKLKPLTDLVSNRQYELHRQREKVATKLQQETEAARQLLLTPGVASKRDPARYMELFWHQRRIGLDVPDLDKKFDDLLTSTLERARQTVNTFKTLGELDASANDFELVVQLIEARSNNSTDNQTKRADIGRYQAVMPLLSALGRQPGDMTILEDLKALDSLKLPSLAGLKEELSNQREVGVRLESIKEMLRTQDIDAARIKFLEETIDKTRPRLGELNRTPWPWLNDRQEHLVKWFQESEVAVWKKRAHYLFGGQRDQQVERVKEFLNNNSDTEESAARAMAYIRWAIDALAGSDPARRQEYWSVVEQARPTSEQLDSLPVERIKRRVGQLVQRLRGHGNEAITPEAEPPPPASDQETYHETNARPGESGFRRPNPRAENDRHRER